MSNYQKSELDIREKYRNRCEGNGLSPRISLNTSGPSMVIIMYRKIAEMAE